MEADNLINQIGDLFDDGIGKGNTRMPGNQHDLNGDVSRLEGIIKGRGQVGGGLRDRGVARTGTSSAKFNRGGTVKVSVCVDRGTCH